MNPALALDIINLALSILINPKGAPIASILMQIFQKANEAFMQQTGQPLDPSLIRTEVPL